MGLFTGFRGVLTYFYRYSLVTRLAHRHKLTLNDTKALFRAGRGLFCVLPFGERNRLLCPMNPVDRTTVIPALPNQAGRTNVPGLRRLWLIEARHLLGVTDPRTMPGFSLSSWTLPATGLQLAEDAAIQAFKFPADRAGHEQKASVGVAGVTYEQTLTLTIPRDHPVTALAMQRMAGRKWVAIYEDGNGERKLVGTLKQPLRFGWQLKTAPNAYQLTWTGSTKQPAYFFDDEGLFTGLASADFSTGFSYDFFA